jgi:hypothetical protein
VGDEYHDGRYIPVEDYRECRDCDGTGQVEPQPGDYDYDDEPGECSWYEPGDDR